MQMHFGDIRLGLEGGCPISATLYLQKEGVLGSNWQGILDIN